MRTVQPSSKSGSDLTALETHFAFGENWADFAQVIDEGHLSAAVDGLRRLLGDVDLNGKRFLDIGCGSGLHSLAALKLGAADVVAIDLDPRSIETTCALLAQHGLVARSRVEQLSVFDLDPQQFGKFDVVYSWGVLHHTGDMLTAVRKAAAMVNDGGSFVFALYRRTVLCPFWKVEKRWYRQASRVLQTCVRNVYMGLFVIALWATGRTLREFSAKRLKQHRGMSLSHDTHDWLGGYPYESISHTDVHALMSELGLASYKSFVRGGLEARLGVFGSGCDEYHYRRP